MVCMDSSLFEKIETKLPQGYNMRQLEPEDYKKGN